MGAGSLFRPHCTACNCRSAAMSCWRTTASRRFGQVFTLELDQLSTELMLPTHAGGAPENRTEVQIRYARGEGTILEGDSAPFHDAQVRAATGPEVQAWLQRSARHYAKLRLGELALAAGVPCLADAGGFNRHSFLCGQSGSGKTYSLGVILEQLLAETDLRIVVLDPNSDFVRLGRGARRRRSGPGRALPEGGARSRGLFRRHPGKAEAAAARGRNRSGHPGRGTPPGPDTGPRGVRRAGRVPGQRRAAQGSRN